MSKCNACWCSTLIAAIILYGIHTCITLNVHIYLFKWQPIHNPFTLVLTPCCTLDLNRHSNADNWPLHVLLLFVALSSSLLCIPHHVLPSLFHLAHFHAGTNLRRLRAPLNIQHSLVNSGNELRRDKWTYFFLTPLYSKWKYILQAKMILMTVGKCFQLCLEY